MSNLRNLLNNNDLRFGLAAQLIMPDYKARIERLVILTVQTNDWNCPQNITPRYTKDEFNA